MWKITYDCLDEKEVNITSWDYTDEKWDAIPSEKKHSINLYDDDDNLYYKGYSSSIHGSEAKAFEPLDWAERDAGCTYMKYLEKGVWKVL
jgi:hypothetical protein